MEQQLLYKNAPWRAIQERIAKGLENTPIGAGTQQQANQLMAVVVEAVQALTQRLGLPLCEKMVDNRSH